MEDPGTEEKKNESMKWIKRFGVAGFLFFLAKGIFWLLAGGAVLKYCAG